jgi:hypothetical protein
MWFVQCRCVVGAVEPVDVNQSELGLIKEELNITVMTEFVFAWFGVRPGCGLPEEFDHFSFTASDSQRAEISGSAKLEQ